MRRTILLLSAAALLVGLAACALEQEPEEAPAEVLPAETATPEPAPTETETVVAPLVIPECTELVDLIALEAATSGPWENFVAAAPDSYHGHQSTMGPKALEALEQSNQHTYCVYVLSGSFGEYAIELLVADLDASARDSLIADLRGSDYAESEHSEGVTAFDYDIFNYGDLAEIRYLFTENAWIISMYRDNRVAADLALESLRAANPTLRAE